MSIKNKKNRKSGIRAGVLSGLMVIGFFSIDNPATALTVFDPTNWIQNFLNQLESVKQNSSWAQQASDMTKQIQDMQKQYDALMSEVGKYSAWLDLSMQSPVDLKSLKREDNAGMAERCPNADPWSVGSLLGFSINPNSDILKMQGQICQLTVVAQNRQFNATIDMILQLEKNRGEYSDISGLLSGTLKPGETGANQAAVQTFTAKMQAELSTWEVQNAAYDSYIAQLQRIQQQLATQALGGRRSSLVGTIAQGAALEIALQGLE